jgi:nitroreductase
MKLSELYKQCRTFRKFKQIEIPEHDMDDILNDLRYVHSGNNRQTLSYIAVQSKAKRDAIAKVIKYASLLPRELADPKPEEEAMAYLVIIADQDHARTADIDTGIAAEYIVESAFEKGIGSCMMLNFNVQKVNEILGLPQNRTAAMVIALGYPSHTSEAVEIGADGSTAYTCDETYHYRVPKKTVKQIAKKI